MREFLRPFCRRQFDCASGDQGIPQFLQVWHQPWALFDAPMALLNQAAEDSSRLKTTS
jgi:hypothetical protein